MPYARGAGLASRLRLVNAQMPVGLPDVFLVGLVNAGGVVGVAKSWDVRFLPFACTELA